MMVRWQEPPPRYPTDGQLVGSGETVPPYIRAVTRDLNNYIANNSPRLIPVGYSAADVRDILIDSFAYLSCAIDGQSDDSRIAFFGLNCKSSCFNKLGPMPRTFRLIAFARP